MESQSSEPFETCQCSHSNQPTNEPEPFLQSEYEETVEYIKEVDEILNSIRPSYRYKMNEASTGDPNNSERLGYDHLENLIRLVQQLKELQQQCPRSCRNLRNLLDFKIQPTFDLPYKDIEFDRASTKRQIFGKTHRSKSINPEALLSGPYLLPKPKVSKWTKVKEAFRWERASVMDAKLTTGSLKKDSPGRLRVAVDKLGDSPSPANSVMSYSSIDAPSSSCHFISSSGYSSACLLDMPPPPPPPPVAEDTSFMSLSLQDLSSSSDSEKLDRLSLRLLRADNEDNKGPGDIEIARRSRSLDGETLVGPEQHFLQFLNKDGLSTKGSKSHKTPWGKVKDIITHSKKNSIKGKKAKTDLKNDGDSISNTCEYSGETPDQDQESFDMVQTPKIEVTELQNAIPIPPPLPPKVNNEPHQGLPCRRLTPMLTITLPSTEELQNVAMMGETVVTSPLAADRCHYEVGSPIDHQEDANKVDKGKLNSRFSGWGKVKRAFFTSGGDHLSIADSTPSSPLQHMSFFSDVESDEPSSGDWSEEKHFTEKLSLESPDDVQTELNKNYCDLQKKLAKEFEEKSKAWDLENEKKMFENTDKLQRKQRDSMTIPLPSINDLSPEFKKKLDEWKKIKKNPASPTTSAAAQRDEHMLHFIARIGEWQRWRPGSHKSDSNKDESQLPEEFCKKLEDWQKLKGRSRSQSDRGKDDNGVRTPSPNLSRKGSKKMKKKFISSDKSSGCESLSGSVKEKGEGKTRKSQKEKDLQWLEKEIQKIEREKQRLEREKEKFLEREARLEQMKRTISTSPTAQEVLIKTPIGFFRFEGISQKFTRKLYEWEKARNIGPEASTFALLASATRSGCETAYHHPPVLQRSKSVGSVIDLSAATTIHHHPSSLSLNDVDELEAISSELLGDSLQSSAAAFSGDFDKEEPEALIVDVEDVVEETAALMETEPMEEGQIPVYCVAENEITTLIDESERDSVLGVSVANVKEDKSTVISETFIDENIKLLHKLECEEEICRKLKEDIEDNDKKGNDANTQQSDNSANKVDRIDTDANLQHCFLEHLSNEEKLASDLVHHLKLLKNSNIGDMEPINSVADIIGVSSQLVTLAEKLQSALNKRNMDVRNSRKPKIRKRLGIKAQMWFSEEQSDVPAQELFNTPDTEEPDVLELPKVIAQKVLILKEGLMNLKLVSDNKPNKESEEFHTSVASVGEQLNRKGSDSIEKDCTSTSVYHMNEFPLERSKAQTFHLEVKEMTHEKNPEVLKRRIKEKISLMHKLSTETKPTRLTSYTLSSNADNVAARTVEEEEEKEGQQNVVVVQKVGKVRKLKTRRITDTTIAYKVESENDKWTETKSDPGEKGYPILLGNTPAFVFVPTSRKIISPVLREGESKSDAVLSYVIDDIPPHEKNNPSETEINAVEELPTSPQKLKETAPSIRMMISKYNQKIADDGVRDEKSGMASPIWRSPILERRMRKFLAKDESSVTLQKEKFEINEVQKSASAGLMQGQNALNKSILKSSSAGIIPEKDTLPIAPLQDPDSYPLALRSLRIKQAKAEFLARGPGGQSWCDGIPSTPTSKFDSLSWASDTDNHFKRISHISVGSDSSFDDMSLEKSTLMVKSVSAGMINLESRSAANEPFCVQKHIPRKQTDCSEEPNRATKFTIKGFQKFRRMRFRKSKCKEGPVSLLCRQSLLLDISRKSPAANKATSKSCPSSPVLIRNRPTDESTSKWNPANIFKAKSLKDNTGPM